MKWLPNWVIRNPYYTCNSRKNHYITTWQTGKSLKWCLGSKTVIRGNRDIGALFAWPSMKCCNNQDEMLIQCHKEMCRSKPFYIIDSQLSRSSSFLFISLVSSKINLHEISVRDNLDSTKHLLGTYYLVITEVAQFHSPHLCINR